METQTFYEVVAGVLQEDILVTYLLIICLDYVLWTSLDLRKENSFTVKRQRTRWYPAETITDADYADDIALLANTPTQADTRYLVCSRQQEALISTWMQTKRITCVLKRGVISTRNGEHLKFIDKFTYLDSNFIFWKQCYYMLSKGVDCCRYAIDYMEVWSIW